MVEEMVGVSEDQCEVVEGLVCKINPDHTHILTAKPSHSLLVSRLCDCDTVTLYSPIDCWT